MKLATLAKYCAGLFVASALLAATDTAAAADRKVFPGFMCVDRNDASPDLTYQFNGSALNPTGSGTDINCSIVRDNTASGMDILDWDVVVDRNGAGAVWDIILFSTNAEGTSAFSSTITVPAGSGFQTLDGGTITSAFDNGQLWIGTTLPAGAEIAAYQIEES